MPRHFDIRVCRGPVCAGQRHADELHAELAAQVAARDLGAVVTLDRQSCFGRCFVGPNVHVRERSNAAPDGEPGSAAFARLSAFYSGVRTDDADEILTAHVLGNRVVERLVRRISPPTLASPATPSGSEPDVRLATALARPEATIQAVPEAKPASMISATPGTDKDPDPSADAAPDPR